MPTTNPRITITLNPALHALLRRLSELSGESQSSMVSDILNRSSPVFERMVQVLEAAHQLKERASLDRVGISESMERANRHLEEQLGIALDTMDEGFRPLVEAVRGTASGADGRRGRGSAVPGADDGSVGRSAPMSNRGVTPLQQAQKKANSKRRQGGQ